MTKKIGVYDNYLGKVTGANVQSFAFKNDDSLSVLHKDLEQEAGSEFLLLRKLGKHWNEASDNARNFSIDKELAKRGAWTIDDLRDLEQYQRQLNQEREKAHRDYLELLLFYISKYDSKK